MTELERQVVESVQRLAPPGWRRIDLRFAATVAVSEVTATVLTADGTAVPSEGAPSQLTDLLMELRRAHFEPERGTWFSAVFLIEPGGRVERLYNRDFDPGWDPPIPAECYQRDQTVMPRAAEHMPAWLRARLEGREPEHPPAAPEPLNPIQQTELMTHDLAVVLGDRAPALWRRLHGYYQAVADHVEFPPVMVFFDDGTMRPWTPPAAAGPLLDRLRAGMYAFEGSTWSRFEFQVRFEDGRVLVDGSHSGDAEPAWNAEPTADDVRRELQRFPVEKVPDWMSRRLGVTPPEPATRTLRRARVFDHPGSDGAPPSVSRPPVLAEEAEHLADYLHNAPLVRAARSYAPDQLAPERGERVPLTFHTDGTWVWAGAVGYYLREHGIPPEPDLVEHIRAQGFRLPEVDDATLEAATAALSNKPAAPPPPPPSVEPPPASVADPTPDAAAPEQTAHGHGDDPGYRWRTFQLKPNGDVWLARVRQRLDELGIDPGAYRLRETAEGAWCLVQDGLRWAVFRYEEGERRNELVFDTGEQAAAQLLGALLLVPQRKAEHAPMTVTDAPPAPFTIADAPPPAEPPPTPEAPPTVVAPPLAVAPPTVVAPPVAEAPPSGDAPPPTMVELPSAFEPFEGEPPLSLFRDKAETELQVGETVDRFGDDNGNVAYAARIPFGQRSLPQDWATRPYHLYRVERPERVLAGVAIPWFDQPGGGKAYVFRRPLSDLVAEGVLVEVQDAPPPPG